MDCLHCGVNFAKWAQREARKAAPAPSPEAENSPTVPRFSWKALQPWTEERTRLTLDASAWLANLLGIKVSRENIDEISSVPASAQGEPTAGERIANFLRIPCSMVIAAGATGLFLSHGFHWAFFGAFLPVVLWWLPWKPARILASLALVPLCAAAGLLGLIIAGGGPDSRGPADLALPLGYFTFALLGAVLFIGIADFRSYRSKSAQTRQSR